jgi:two-component system NtrC family sensor kinase
MLEITPARIPKPETPLALKPAPAEFPARRPRRRQARILMIDDQPALGEMICEFLELSGHHAQFCSNAQDALAMMQQSDFDLIISDFRMPGLSGAQLFEQILARAPNLARRVVFMTGDTVSPQARQFFDRHDVPCLTKPFALPTLESFITTHLELLAQAA